MVQDDGWHVGRALAVRARDLATYGKPLQHCALRAVGTVPELLVSQRCVAVRAAQSRSWVVLGVIDHEEHDGDGAES